LKPCGEAMGKSIEKCGRREKGEVGCWVGKGILKT